LLTAVGCKIKTAAMILSSLKFTKMKKFKFPLLAALLIAVAGVFAFTLPGKTAKTFNTYHYTSSSVEMEDLQNPVNWEGVEPAEGCDEFGTIPCTISTDKDLEEYLEEFTTANALIGAAVTKRN
jgi:hypothetical protein